MQNENSLLLDRFESLGLSRSEGLVYLALLTYQAPVTGYQLSKDHNIVRAITYEMLNRLLERGGVRIAQGSPELYSPVPPEIFLSLLEKRFHDAKKDLVSRLHTLDQTDKEVYWNISGFDVIMAAVQAMAAKAQKSILFYFNNPVCAKLLSDVFSKKAAAGIKIQGFSYRAIRFDFDYAEIYSYNIPQNAAISVPEGRIIVVVDDKQSVLGDLDRGYASQSSSPSQVETARDYIRMKISLYRFAQIIEPSKMALYLFEEDRLFFEQIRSDLH